MADPRPRVKLSKMSAEQSTAVTRSAVNRPSWHPMPVALFALFRRASARLVYTAPEWAFAGSGPRSPGEVRHVYTTRIRTADDRKPGVPPDGQARRDKGWRGAARRPDIQFPRAAARRRHRPRRRDHRGHEGLRAERVRAVRPAGRAAIRSARPRNAWVAPADSRQAAGLASRDADRSFSR